MRILTRYVLRSHVAPFLFALTVLTGLLFVNTIARRFEELAGKGLPLSVIFEVFALSLPHILALTLPMAVLVAVLYTFSALTAENEITALKASGISLRMLLVPLVAAGAVLGGFMVYFNDRILPETNHSLKTLLVDIARKSPTFNLKEQVINTISTADLRTRYYLQAAHINTSTNELTDVVIYDLSVPGRDRTVYAERGRMAFNREQTNLFLLLYDGRIHQMQDSEPAGFQRVFFKESMLELEGVGNQLQRNSEDDYRSDREMSLAMLSAQVDSSRAELAQIKKDAEKQNAMAVQEAVARGVEAGALDALAGRAAMEMRMLESRAKGAQQRMDQYRVEYHKKFAIPFACIVFVLLGAPLAVRFPRGGVGMVIAVSLVIFGTYYISLIGGESLGDRGRVSPFWGPWAPNFIFLVIAAWGLTRIGKETATARSGGGWEEWWSAIKDFMGAKREFRWR